MRWCLIHSWQLRRAPTRPFRIRADGNVLAVVGLGWRVNLRRSCTLTQDVAVGYRMIKVWWFVLVLYYRGLRLSYWLYKYNSLKKKNKQKKTQRENTVLHPLPLYSSDFSVAFSAAARRFGAVSLVSELVCCSISAAHRAAPTVHLSACCLHLLL